MECPHCKSLHPPGIPVCGHCGHDPGEPLPNERSGGAAAGRPIVRQRRHVTVLFSDLSGYTALSETLDPEDVKEISGHLFDKVSDVITRYGGFVEKYVGDAVMAVFGAVKAHEDDPVRAIKAAMEIHDRVEALSLQYLETTGCPLSMHTGINTGLVVTGDVDPARGTHGLVGDAINVAARLSSAATPGEIWVGQDTRAQAENFFVFDALVPIRLKGKRKPVPVYKVRAPRPAPEKIHRRQGVRASLIGRKAEMDRLRNGVARLRSGRGSVFAVCGTAGTGKSRLVGELKAAVNPAEIQWHEGHAYPYAQDIPYFPLIDLLHRAFDIQTGDLPEKRKQRLETGISALLADTGKVTPYLGSLLSLQYPGVDAVSPEYWKTNLQQAVASIFSALARKTPTVVCLEDLHWADRSFLELMRSIMADLSGPILFLCVYRPVISLFTGRQRRRMGWFEEIRIQDLSSSDSRALLAALLQTRKVPEDLQTFLDAKAAGNPFYLEEMVNSLIDSKVLVPADGTWQVARPITDADISASIHGVLSARLDRLGKKSRQIIQEASVIGRAFHPEILNRISLFRGSIDPSLASLADLDLIQEKSLPPDREYVFKHALTREVVYRGLVKKDRRRIHERIGRAIEKLYADRLPEFYETLAFHFKRGNSTDKAIEYLIRSGVKTYRRFSVEQAHGYFSDACRLLAEKPSKTEKDKDQVIGLIVKWAQVFYARGDFKGLTGLLRSWESTAAALDDRVKTGMFYGWSSMAQWALGNLESAYRYASQALFIGEAESNRQVICYACTYLCWTCAELGRLTEAVAFGQKAQNAYQDKTVDDYFYYKSLAGLGYCHYLTGAGQKVFDAGSAMVAFGQRHSNSRSLVWGYVTLACGHLLDGNTAEAVRVARTCLDIPKDPYYALIANFFLAMSYTFNQQLDAAAPLWQAVIASGRNSGMAALLEGCRVFSGLVMAAAGRLGPGLRMMTAAKNGLKELHWRSYYALAEYLTGRVYLQLAIRSTPIRLSFVVQNLGFLIKNIPVAEKRAETHLKTAVRIAEDAGLCNLLGNACLDLGRLYQSRQKPSPAREYIGRAIQVFERNQARTGLKQARGLLGEIGERAGRR